MTTLLVNGSAILAAAPQDHGDHWDAGDLIVPKSTAPGAQVVEAGPLPLAFSPQACTWANGALVANPPAPAPVPQIVSRMQLKRALNQEGLLTSLETAVAASTDTDLKIYWAETSEFHRDHPKLNAALTALGFTAAQADQAFILAATLS